MDPLIHDVAEGVPGSEIAGHQASTNNQGMWQGLTYLRQAHIGIFSQLKEDWSAPPPPGSRLDGLNLAAGGWFTVGGSSSIASLERNRGQTMLRWDYRVASHVVPMLIRSFPEPENWLHGQALAGTFDGRGTGNVIHLRLVSALSGGRLGYWETDFVDNHRGIRTVVLPWIDFTYVSASGQLGQTPLVLDTSSALQHVFGVVFGIAGHGRGDLMIERLSLGAGHQELMTKTWPEPSRHSLPPWPGWIPG